MDTIQSCGGQKTADGIRFRTGGGILWNILKTREPKAYKEIMAKGKEFEVPKSYSMYTQHTTSCFSILLVYYAGVNWIFTALLSNYVGVNVCTGCLVFCIYMPVKNKIAKNPSFFEGTCCLKNSI